MTDYLIEDRPAQAVAGITKTVTMATMNEIADEIPGLLGWLDDHGYAPAGAPFLRYLVIDMAADMVVQAGVPVDVPVGVPAAEAIEGDGRVTVDQLPAGRYLTTTHVGPYEGLYDATVGILRYAGTHGLSFDQHPSDNGDVWASRIEWYETNPVEQPDPATWVTRLTFKLVD
jgi:effector-binding domain-containing protein